jgi:hypothetical protein
MYKHKAKVHFYITTSHDYGLMWHDQTYWRLGDGVTVALGQVGAGGSDARGGQGVW